MRQISSQPASITRGNIIMDVPVIWLPRYPNLLAAGGVANRSAEAESLAESIATWLKKVDAKEPADEVRRKKWAETQASFIPVLRSIGREDDADQVMSVIQR